MVGIQLQALYLGFFFVTTDAALAVTSQAPLELTLKSCLLESERRHPGFEMARAAAQIAKLEKDAAFTHFLPSLTLSADHGVGDKIPKSGRPPYQSQLNLNLKENLYDNGQSVSKYKIASLQTEIADLELRLKRDALALDIAQAFIDFNIEVQLLEIREGQHLLLQRQLRQVESSFKQGLKTRKDYLRFVTQTRRSEIELKNLRRSIALIRIGLTQKIDPTASTPLQFASYDFNKSLPRADEKAVPALEANAHLYSLKEEVAKRDREQVLKNRWPSLDLSAGLSYGASDYMGTGRGYDDGVNWNVMLSMEYPLWNWNRSYYERQIARASFHLEQARLQTDRQEDEMKIAQSQLKVRDQIENVKNSEELLKMEEDNFKAVERDYRLGKVEYLDFLAALTALGSAKESFVRILADIHKEHYFLLAKKGLLFDELTR